jgi:hypothetical protein
MGKAVGEKRASKEVRNGVIPAHDAFFLVFEPMIADPGSYLINRF